MDFKILGIVTYVIHDLQDQTTKVMRESFVLCLADRIKFSE